jgi:hypothetical protein
MTHRVRPCCHAVAGRHGLNTGRLYTWRRQLQPSLGPTFARVELADPTTPVATAPIVSAVSASGIVSGGTKRHQLDTLLPWNWAVPAQA